MADEQNPRINYISQMNAFRERKIETPGITSGIIAVYYALLDMNNQSKWSEEFDVDFGYMMALAKVDKTTYYKALNFLQENGFITNYQKGKNLYTRAKVTLCLLYDKSLGNSEGKQVGNPLGNSESEQNNSKTLNTKPKKEKNDHLIDPLFDQFWDIYKKKVGRDKALTKWKTLAGSDKLEILKVVPDYVKSTPDKQFRKDPITYLNGGHWKDELIIDSNIPDASTPNDFVLGKPRNQVKHTA
ncbi:hypothetical protein H9X96_03210 [Pedobacter sp. N36a]|uniref:hypothetical protein n=1 Tax=Pedobacter sp. N36a TaxID=2767996 RepID=UPI001656F7F6|nr:hypothetical protein [Pedobacter sp. N36a]MBC8984779.1 hypothetical protein [Pedobacter sp. N36a]